VEYKINIFFLVTNSPHLANCFYPKTNIPPNVPSAPPATQKPKIDNYFLKTRHVSAHCSSKSPGYKKDFNKFRLS
jgi:hypothetical protein